MVKKGKKKIGKAQSEKKKGRCEQEITVRMDHGHGGISSRLDWMILAVFSNVNGSVIL